MTSLNIKLISDIYIYCSFAISLVKIKPDNNSQFSNMALDIQNSETTKQRLSCDLCDKTLACRVSLLNHKVLVHKLEKPFKCDKCGKGFENERVLKRHENERVKFPHICSTTSNTIKCELCDKILAVQCWRKHIKIVHEKIEALQ